MFVQTSKHQRFLALLFCNASIFISNQGLGTVMVEEVREYFKQLNEHMRTFVWTDEDGKAIEVAFGKIMIKDRKKWLHEFKVIVGTLGFYF